MTKQLAVVVGVSDYPRPEWHLPGVAADVREMAALLGSPSGHFHAGGVAVLADAEATRASVLAALDAAFLGAAPGDTVFAYMAGHGGVEGGAFYFLTHDSTEGALKDVCLPLAAIKGLFDRSPSRRAFLFLDFCHSGGIFRGGPAGGETARSILGRALSVVQGEGKVIVAACTESQYAMEDAALGHGVFTAHLLRGLRGEAAQAGEVTANSLFDYLDRAMGSTSQRPMMFGHATGRIVLMHHGHGAAGKPPAVAGPAAGACVSSGDWVLLHTSFLPADEVRHNADGTFTVELQGRSPEENAAIKSLHPSRADRPRPVAFAHGDDGLAVTVKELTGRSAGGRQVWVVTLKPEALGSSFVSEMSYQGVSAERIAEMRAGRLLLNDPPPPQGRRGVEDSFLEMGIRGDSRHYPPVESCILKAVHAEHGGRDVFLSYARLAAVYALKMSGCVEEVLELRLGPVGDGRCPVRFRGRRAKRYSNVEPHVFALEGECLLA